MGKYFICAAIFFLGSLWSLYSILYYGWLTATPLKEGYLEIYQKSAIYWMIILVVLIILIFACLIRAYYIWRKDVAQQVAGGDATR